MLDLSSGLGVGGKEPALDDDADIDISRLSAVDREAIMARVTPDDSTPPDAFALAQNEIRREVQLAGLSINLNSFICSDIVANVDD
ncbi:unnamed protein product [Phytophthora lilii]|uniref:Unnamed protein product n=1 Tax=Phytophthora lilii TaxID=2077276 RepID=A0A9W6TLJ2_9STRA|nr:unnamed protein product [Phytophthora lilii]